MVELILNDTNILPVIERTCSKKFSIEFRKDGVAPYVDYSLDTCVERSYTGKWKKDSSGAYTFIDFSKINLKSSGRNEPKRDLKRE